MKRVETSCCGSATCKHLPPVIMTLQESESSTDAKAPFNNPSADLILCSSDKVNFRVWKSILGEASPVFSDMFALGRPPAGSSQLSSDEKCSRVDEVILDLPDLTSSILRRLLLTIYPRSNLSFASLDDLIPVLAGAHKYQMDAVINSLKDVIIRDFVKEESLRVFCVATQYKLLDLRDAAARRFLALSANAAVEAYVDELQNIDAGSYHQLLAYRRRCAKVLAEATKVLSWFPDGVWAFTTLVGCGCRHDNETLRPLRSPDGGEEGRHIKYWFISHYYERCAAALQNRPCSEALADPALCDQALKEATRCEKCRNVVHEHMRIFMISLSQYVDRKVDETTIDVYGPS